MADPITIEVAFEGGDEAARVAERLTQLMQRLGQAEGEAATAGARQAQAQQAVSQAQQAAATQAIAFTQRIGAAANAVQSLAAQLGSRDRTAGLVGALAASAAAGAQFGATFGPGGAVIGGILGAIPAIQQLVASMDDLAVAQQRAREQAELLARATARTSAARQAQIDRQLARGSASGLSRDEISRERSIREAQLQELGAQVEYAQGQVGRGGERGRRAADELADYQAEIRDIISQLGALGEAEGRLISPLGSRGRATGPQTRDRRRGGGAGRDLEGERLAREQQLAEELLRIQEEYNDRKLEAERARIDEERELALALAEDQRRLEQERLDALEREKDKQREVIEANIAAVQEANEAKKAAYDQQVSEIEGTTSVIVGGLTDTLAAIVSGQKSAEQAFAGLLASFLEYIAEQSALSAAREAAEAIASFARYDYSGGAQHLAAAAAYAGVAIAAGAGSVAVSQAAAAQAPAGVDRSAGSRDARAAGDIVINYNSPVITAGTRAELGNEIRSVVRSAERAYGV